MQLLGGSNYSRGESRGHGSINSAPHSPPSYTKPQTPIVFQHPKPSHGQAGKAAVVKLLMAKNKQQRAGAAAQKEAHYVAPQPVIAGRYGAIPMNVMQGTHPRAGGPDIGGMMSMFAPAGVTQHNYPGLGGLMDRLPDMPDVNPFNNPHGSVQGLQRSGRIASRQKYPIGQNDGAAAQLLQRLAGR